MNLIIFCDATAPGGLVPPCYRGFTITLRHNTLGSNPLDEWSARRSDLHLTTHSTQNTYLCHRGIRTCNPSKRAATDPQFRSRVHWDRPNKPYSSLELHTVTTLFYLMLRLELTMKRFETKYPETILKTTHYILSQFLQLWTLNAKALY